MYPLIMKVQQSVQRLLSVHILYLNELSFADLRLIILLHFQAEVSLPYLQLLQGLNPVQPHLVVFHFGRLAYCRKSFFVVSLHYYMVASILGLFSILEDNTSRHVQDHLESILINLLFLYLQNFSGIRQ